MKVWIGCREAFVRGKVPKVTPFYSFDSKLETYAVSLIGSEKGWVC